MNYKELEQELLKDKSFKKYFEKNKLSHEIAVSVMSARIIKGLSQTALAKKVKTKQPSIARLERGSCLPTLSFLKRIAEALDTELIAPKFKSLEDKNKSTNKSYEIRNVLTFNYVVNETTQTSSKSNSVIKFNNLN